MSNFQPPAWFRMASSMVKPMIRLGLPVGSREAPMALLTVPGRKSGIDRTTPIALAAHGDGWLLVAVYGVADWARNLEASRQARITMRGEDIDVTARRLEPETAGPILRDSMEAAPGMIQRMTDPYFSAGFDDPVENWERESISHPVFVLTRVGD